MSTCKPVGLTLGSQAIKPRNLPDHWFVFQFLLNYTNSVCSDGGCERRGRDNVPQSYVHIYNNNSRCGGGDDDGGPEGACVAISGENWYLV
jgi:hypothetical protein